MNAGRKTYTTGGMAILIEVFAVVAAAVITAWGVLALAKGLVTADIGAVSFGAFSTVFGLIVGYAFGHLLLRVPHGITVDPDGTLEFVALTRRERLSARELLSVDKDEDDLHFHHSGGTITAHWVNNLEDLLDTIRELNPKLRVLRFGKDEATEIGFVEPQSRALPSAKRVCPLCGHANPFIWHTCQKCGRPLRSHQRSSVQTMILTQAAPLAILRTYCPTAYPTSMRETSAYLDDVHVERLWLAGQAERRSQAAPRLRPMRLGANVCRL